MITGQSDGNHHQMPLAKFLVFGVINLHSLAVFALVLDTSLLLLR